MNLSALKSQSVRFENLATTIILLALVFNALFTMNASILSNPALSILGLEDPTSYMKRHLGSYVDAMKEIEALPPGSKVLMLWETRAMLYIPTCDPDEIIGRWYNNWSNYRNPEKIILTWKEQGYTHVLINRTGANFIHKYDKNSPPDEYWLGLENTLADLADTYIPIGNYQLYKIP